ncbi:hypothetical protein LTR85_000411 [Meristemomyces frigidus]|nr:hypothetical protein LTR85_000411 [Meristemomyces frigidus]
MLMLMLASFDDVTGGPEALIVVLLSPTLVETKPPALDSLTGKTPIELPPAAELEDAPTIAELIIPVVLMACIPEDVVLNFPGMDMDIPPVLDAVEALTEDAGTTPLKLTLETVVSLLELPVAEGVEEPQAAGVLSDDVEVTDDSRSVVEYSGGLGGMEDEVDMTPGTDELVEAPWDDVKELHCVVIAGAELLLDIDWLVVPAGMDNEKLDEVPIPAMLDEEMTVVLMPMGDVELDDEELELAPIPAIEDEELSVLLMPTIEDGDDEMGILLVAACEEEDELAVMLVLDDIELVEGATLEDDQLLGDVRPPVDEERLVDPEKLLLLLLRVLEDGLVVVESPAVDEVRLLLLLEIQVLDQETVVETAPVEELMLLLGLTVLDDEDQVVGVAASVEVLLLLVVREWLLLLDVLCVDE